MQIAALRERPRSHCWTGNVRELRNVMERLAYLSEGDAIEADDLAFILAPSGEAAPLVSAELPLAEATDRFQADYIRRVVNGAAGNVSAASKRLGLHRSNLYRKMRQLGMDDSRAKELGCEPQARRACSIGLEYRGIPDTIVVVGAGRRVTRNALRNSVSPRRPDHSPP